MDRNRNRGYCFCWRRRGSGRWPTAPRRHLCSPIPTRSVSLSSIPAPSTPKIVDFWHTYRGTKLQSEKRKKLRMIWSTPVCKIGREHSMRTNLKIALGNPCAFQGNRVLQIGVPLWFACGPLNGFVNQHAKQTIGVRSKEFNSCSPRHALPLAVSHLDVHAQQPPESRANT